jgi:hypothetical protein
MGARDDEFGARVRQILSMECVGCACVCVCVCDCVCIQPPPPHLPLLIITCVHSDFFGFFLGEEGPPLPSVP